VAEGNKNRLAKRTRWAGRIIGILVIGGFLLTLIVSGISEAIAGNWEALSDIEGIMLAVITAVALAGCILSWWRELPAGIIVILAAVTMGTYSGITAGRNNIIVGLMLGLLYIAPGVLFLVSWRLSKKLPDIEG